MVTLLVGDSKLFEMASQLITLLFSAILAFTRGVGKLVVELLETH